MIGLVESKIVAAIRAAQLAYRLHFVGSYGGEFDDDIGLVVRNMPGVWVTFGGSQNKPHGVSKDQQKVTARFAVVVGARNVRGEEATRQGTTAPNGTVIEPGTYRMLEDIRAVLWGLDFGLPIEPLEPRDVKTLYNTRLNDSAIAVFAQEYETCWLEKRPLRDETGALLPEPGPLLKTVGMTYVDAGDQSRVVSTDVVTLNP